MSNNDSLKWDEERCKDGLAHLENLQNQIDEVRLSIPRIVQTLVGNHQTPQHLFWEFKSTINNSRKRLGEFEGTWNSARTQNILAHARESQKANADLRAGYSMPRYGWLDENYVPEVIEIPEVPIRPVKEEIVPDPSDGTVKSEARIFEMVDEYKKKHSSFNVDQDKENKTFKIKYKADSTHMNFVVSYQQDDSGLYTFRTECSGSLGGPKLDLITKCIRNRPNPYDLQYLLDMIAAYKDVRLTPCAKCGIYAHKNALLPAARRPRNPDPSDDSDSPVWKPYHEECL